MKLVMLWEKGDIVYIIRLVGGHYIVLKRTVSGNADFDKGTVMLNNGTEIVGLCNIYASEEEAYKEAIKRNKEQIKALQELINDQNKHICEHKEE